MHILQPKHTRLDEKEVQKVLDKYNIVVSQLPKISAKDPSLTESCSKGDVIKIERAKEVYFRVVA